MLVLAFLIILFGMQIPTFAKTALLSIITFAGVTMRENIIALPASLLVVDLNQLRLRDGLQAITQQINKVLRIALVPLLAGLAGIAFTRHIAVGSGYPGYWATVMWFLENKPVTSWMLAWFGMFGPLLALVLYDGKATLKFLRGKPVLWAFSAMIATLSFIGGTDTERFLGWMFPIVFVLIGMSIERCLPVLRSAWVLVPLVITQTFAMRLFWSTPHYKIKGCTGEPTFTFLTILGKCVTVPQLFVDAAPEHLLQVIFLQWVSVVVGFVALLWFLDHKRKKNDPGSVSIRS